MVRNRRPLLVVALFAASEARAGTIHVPGDQPTIQAGILAATDGDEVLVAPGFYLETINFFGKTIVVRSAGGAAATTIDGGGAPHVVECFLGEGPATVLEGFTITGGDATGIPDGAGGGMFNAASTTVTDCVFVGNSAEIGGGMYIGGTSPTISGCAFDANSADQGGGMFVATSSDPMVADCTFTANTALAGGGMYCQDGSNPTVTDSTFSGNLVPIEVFPNMGGGLASVECNLILTGCTFVGNEANGGGGLYATGSAVVSACTFEDNEARSGGGARLAGAMTVSGCRFTGNFALSSGGGLHGGPTLVNCAFFANTSGVLGGAIAGLFPRVTNCTFSGNATGPSGGGALYSDHDHFGPVPQIIGCIFWNNVPNEIRPGVLAPEGPHFSYCDITNSGGSGVGWDTLIGQDGGGNVDVDPQFVDVLAGDLRLSFGSPVIDAGDNDAPDLVGVLTDLAGDGRFVDDPATADTGNGVAPIVDMGAYEYQLPECFLVIGHGPDADVFDGGIHTWVTQVSSIALYDGVLMDDLPVFDVPVSDTTSGPTGATWRGAGTGFRLVPYRRFYAQVLLWNPQVFPANPERWSEGLEVTLWPNGSVIARPYGTRNGMNLTLETLTAPDGTPQFRLPFTIDGI